MPRKTKKSGNVVVNVNVNTERKRKPRKKRASSRKKRGAQYLNYSGASTIYGEPLPLPRQTIEVNVPYLLQPGQRLASGEIGVPLLQNAPQRQMIMEQPARQQAPAIMDDNVSQASSQRSYMKPSFREELNTVSSSQQENASIASMEEPHSRDPLDYVIAEDIDAERRDSPSFLSRAKSAVVRGGLEAGANALIGAVSVAASPFIPPSITGAVLTAGKEGAKSLYQEAQQKKQVEFAVERKVEKVRREQEFESIPLRSDAIAKERYKDWFGGTNEAGTALRSFQRKNQGATFADFERAYADKIPPRRR